MIPRVFFKHVPEGGLLEGWINYCWCRGLRIVVWLGRWKQLYFWVNFINTKNWQASR